MPRKFGRSAGPMRYLETVHLSLQRWLISTTVPEPAQWWRQLVSMPMFWLTGKGVAKSRAAPPDGIPLVLFDHPSIFSQSALLALDGQGVRWRLALFAPSSPGVWAL
jgi:hypothetical protein